MVILLALGCAGDAGEALVMTGWQYEWESLSHRIGFLRAQVEQDSSLDLGLIGGDFSTGESMTDVPGWRVRYARVRAPDTDFVEGEVDVEMGPDWDATAEITVDVAGLPERGSLVALIQGFSIDPGIEQSADYPDYEARYGYTTQGFAFGLGEPTRSGDSVTIPVSASVRWSPQDREDMNAAIPFARTGVHVRALLVSTDGDLATAEVNASEQYPEGMSETEQPPLEMSATLQGEAREGFVGWTRFDLQGNFFGPDAGEGDYVRAMGAEYVPTDDGGGALTAAVTGTFTNRSLLQLTQWASGFEGSLVRVGAKGADVEHFVVEGSHPAGEAETDPTLP